MVFPALVTSLALRAFGSELGPKPLTWRIGTLRGTIHVLPRAKIVYFGSVAVKAKESKKYQFMIIFTNEITPLS